MNVASRDFLRRTPLLQALIGLFELPEDDSVPDDEHFIEIEDTPGTVISRDHTITGAQSTERRGSIA